MVLNGNKKKVWFWLIMSNIQCPFWLLVMCFDPGSTSCQFVQLWLYYMYYEYWSKYIRLSSPYEGLQRCDSLVGGMSMPKTRILGMAQVRVSHGRMSWLWSWEMFSHLSSWVFTFHWLESILEMFPTRGYRNEWRWQTQKKSKRMFQRKIILHIPHLLAPKHPKVYQA